LTVTSNENEDSKQSAVVFVKLSVFMSFVLVSAKLFVVNKLPISKRIS
jgi:hypothetical protein